MNWIRSCTLLETQNATFEDASAIELMTHLIFFTFPAVKETSNKEKLPNIAEG